MKVNIYFWGIIGFFSIVIALLIWKHFPKGSHYQDACTVDDDCSKGYKCIFSRDMNHNICVLSNDKECNISTDIAQMQSCDPKDNNSCNMCINQPAFSCVVVGKLELKTGGNRYKDGICSTTTTGSGTGMTVNITTLGGVVQDVSIIETGNNYTKNDTITILCDDSDNSATLKFSENPYIWKHGTDIINVPESLENKGWCLPDVKQTTSCNQFTSDTILVEYEDNKYEWGCHCTIQNLFDQLSPLSDCNLEKACGHDSGFGDLYVVKNMDDGNQLKCNTNSECITAGADSLCCVPDTTGNLSGSCDDNVSGSEQKYCHVPWLSQPNSDPRYGRCKCGTGLTYFGYSDTNIYTKNCVKDSCEPNGIKVDTSCECNPGYIRCPEDTKNISYKQNCEGQPQCIPDPCQPFGTYDKDAKSCNCIDTAGIADDKSNSIGETCVEFCKNNGPCGDRGTCILIGSDSYRKPFCKNCRCPYCNPGDTGCGSSEPGYPNNCTLRMPNMAEPGQDCFGMTCCAPGECKYDPYLGRSCQ
jgi:hypothetical protein